MEDHSFLDAFHGVGLTSRPPHDQVDIRDAAFTDQVNDIEIFQLDMTQWPLFGIDQLIVLDRVTQDFLALSWHNLIKHIYFSWLFLYKSWSPALRLFIEGYFFKNIQRLLAIF